MPSDLEGTSPERQPSELARAEPEAGVTNWLHCQGPGVAALLAHFGHAIRSAKHEQRLDDTYVKQEPDPENREADPQRLLPRGAQVEAPPYHVQQPRRDRYYRQHDMGQVPSFVANVPFRTPHGHHH